MTDIVRLLTETYTHGILLNGIILLQSVDGNRAYGSERQRMQLFRGICGTDSFGHVVIGTTMWDKLKLQHRREGRRRVQERVGSETLWAEMVRYGTEVVEHRDNRRSATNIVRKLMGKGKVTL